MRPFVALLTTSLRQALPLRRTIALVVLQLAPAGIYLLASTGRTESAAFEALVGVGVGTYFALALPVTSIVVAAGVLGHERRDLTLGFIALRPIPRVGVAAAKLVAAVVASFLIAGVGGFALGTLHAVRFGGGDVVVGFLAGAGVAVVAYTCIFVPLGFITDRAVIIGMGYLLVFENGAAFLLTGLSSLSPWRLGAATFADVVPLAERLMSEAIGALEQSAGRTLFTLLLYVAVSLAVTTNLLRTRDLA